MVLCCLLRRAASLEHGALQGFLPLCLSPWRSHGHRRFVKDPGLDTAPRGLWQPVSALPGEVQLQRHQADRWHPVRRVFPVP